MKIELHEIFVKDIVNGYKDNQEDGVVGYGGKLDIRPPYQREFVYKEEQRDAVITSVLNGFPLNGRAGYVSSAASILTSNKWKATILRRGTQAEKRIPIIAKCCVKIATEGKQGVETAA